MIRSATKKSIDIALLSWNAFCVWTKCAPKTIKSRSMSEESQKRFVFVVTFLVLLPLNVMRIEHVCNKDEYYSFLWTRQSILNMFFWLHDREARKEKEDLSIFLPDLKALLLFCVPEIICVLLKLELVLLSDCSLCNLIYRD